MATDIAIRLSLVFDVPRGWFAGPLKVLFEGGASAAVHNRRQRASEIPTQSAREDAASMYQPFV